jgi:glycosyltransferase involved in cell wall biosynthesis
LARTLESLLAQDYANLEIVVSESESTDNTAQVADTYADRGVRCVRNPGADNWNYVLAYALSLGRPLIALFHADDLYAPTMVSRQVGFLQAHPEVCSVFTMSQRIDEEDRPIRMGITRLPDDLRGRDCFTFPTLFNAILKYTDFISTPTLMARRGTLEAMDGFDPQFVSAVDLDLWLRMARYGPIGIIDEPLHLYRISAGQGSAQMEQSRTFEAHWFSVMDHFMALPEVRKITRADALAFYEMQRSIDRVRRAMLWLANERPDEAGSLLDAAHPWRYLFLARGRPYRLAQLMVGTMLWLCGRLGLAHLGGRVAYRLYQSEVKRRQQAANSSSG